MVTLHRFILSLTLPFNGGDNDAVKNIQNTLEADDVTSHLLYLYTIDSCRHVRCVLHDEPRTCEDEHKLFRHRHRTHTYKATEIFAVESGAPPPPPPRFKKCCLHGLWALICIAESAVMREERQGWCQRNRNHLRQEIDGRKSCFRTDHTDDTRI